MKSKKEKKDNYESLLIALKKKTLQVHRIPWHTVLPLHLV